MKNQTLPVKTRILFLFTLLFAAMASVQNLHAATVTSTADSGAAHCARRWLTQMTATRSISLSPAQSR
jgi:hypothetical protein